MDLRLHNHRRSAIAAVLSLIALLAPPAGAEPRKLALLIGIDDYSASALPDANNGHRGWPDLKGAANDANLLREMLLHTYGFRADDILTLTNQKATRANILRAIEEHLVRRARSGDLVLYYYAGHGSQVPNPQSDEPDGLDESIVPADSRKGAKDIRDKELRASFNRILDRGARLTLLLDHCHSGSGFRGLPSGARPRGIHPAEAIADSARYGARPEERGALVLASTQDADGAFELRGEDGLMHGAFTWAWLRAMRDAASGESAEETFLRAQARLRAETPFQAPVMLGNAQARLRPFLGTRIRHGDRLSIAVEKVERDGTVVVQGGWANGLAVNTLLAVRGKPTTRLRVQSLLGLGRSVARIESGRTVTSGALLEIIGWAAPQGRALRVWAPWSAEPHALARKFAAATRAQWISDPFDHTPTHLLRPRSSGWELLTLQDRISLRGNDAAISAIARLPVTASLFVQFPSPTAVVDNIDGVVAVDDPENADYILAGRFAGRRVEYSFIRPLMRTEDRSYGGLPPRTAWSGDAQHLRNDLLKLRRIHAWHRLESPPSPPAPYRLALARLRSNELVHPGAVIGGETYRVVLQAARPSSSEVPRRYYYVFVIDSHGKSQLAFPTAGSNENRFPIRAPAPESIDLGPASAFRILPPYGVDTYFLLSTDEPLPNPSILAWDGVRAMQWTKPHTPLEELLLLTATGTRAKHALVTNAWSIERVTFESAAPQRQRKSGATPSREPG